MERATLAIGAYVALCLAAGVANVLYYVFYYEMAAARPADGQNGATTVEYRRAFDRYAAMHVTRYVLSILALSVGAVLMTLVGTVAGHVAWTLMEVAHLLVILLTVAVDLSKKYDGEEGQPLRIKGRDKLERFVRLAFAPFFFFAATLGFLFYVTVHTHRRSLSALRIRVHAVKTPAALCVVLIGACVLGIAAASWRQVLAADPRAFAAGTLVVRFCNALATAVLFTMSVSAVSLPATGVWGALALTNMVAAVLTAVVSLNGSKDAQRIREDGYVTAARLPSIGDWQRFEDQYTIGTCAAGMTAAAFTLMELHRRHHRPSIFPVWV